MNAWMHRTNNVTREKIRSQIFQIQGWKLFNTMYIFRINSGIADRLNFDWWKTTCRDRQNGIFSCKWGKPLWAFDRWTHGGWKSKCNILPRLQIVCQHFSSIMLRHPPKIHFDAVMKKEDNLSHAYFWIFLGIFFGNWTKSSHANSIFLYPHCHCRKIKNAFTFSSAVKQTDVTCLLFCWNTTAFTRKSFVLS